MISRIIWFLVVILVISSASLAEAHAFLDHAEPPVGSQVQTSPDVVKIWFTRTLKAPDSTVQVFSGLKEIDQRDAKIDPDDTTLIQVKVQKLPVGVYLVKWTAVSHDGHITHGQYSFEVTNP